jgi:hypothetical protein
MQRNVVILPSLLSNGDPATVIRTPYTSDAFVDTPDRFCDSFQLLAAGISQKLGLLQYLLLLQVPNADCLFAAIDIVPNYNRVFSRSWRNSHFDLRVCCCESRKRISEE